jgi:hypothetical protein
MLSGYKTYLSAGAIVVVAGMHALGYISDGTYQTLIGLLGAGGLAALRAGIGKL